MQLRSMPRPPSMERRTRVRVCDPGALSCPICQQPFRRVEVGEGCYAFGYCEAKRRELPDQPRCNTHIWINVEAGVATVTVLDNLEQRLDLARRLAAARRRAAADMASPTL
jgi:hypothetical protein